MKVLVMGGPRHGEWVEVLDGVAAWVDIRNALTFRIRRVTWSITNAATKEIIESYAVYLAIHPDLTGPAEPQVVGDMLHAVAMNAFAREHGELTPVPHEPSAAERSAP